MELIIARHGNTFKPNEPVVWVGCSNDLPLVESGQAQAKIFGRALLANNKIPATIYCGPLQRMTSYARLIQDELKIDTQISIDDRLNEIDYGAWSGLTSQEVCEQFGIDAFENWENDSKWPDKGNWKESATLVTERIKAFVNELVSQHSSNDTVLIVSSNGCLRYFLDLIPGKLQEHIHHHTFKMATGNLSQFSYDHEMKIWTLNSWNVSPINLLTPISP